jgi:fructose/tagatose bisphosphate aldolase
MAKIDKKNLYENDVERLYERVELVVGSFHGASGVDQERLRDAADYFLIAYVKLRRAAGLE